MTYAEVKKYVNKQMRVTATSLQKDLKISNATAKKYIAQLIADGTLTEISPRTPKIVTKNKAKLDKLEKDRKEKQAKSKKKTGRKEQYEELRIRELLLSVEGWTKQGATMDELGTLLGVSKTTIYRWREEYEEFRSAIMRGRHVASGELIASAFNASKGFMMPVKAAIKRKVWKKFKVNGKEEMKQEEVIEYIDSFQYVQPNAQLLQFMLTNLLPKEYQSRQSIEHIESGGNSLAHLSDEALEEEIRKLKGGDDT